MTSKRRVFNKNILVAVDHSDNAKRAVDYVGQLLGRAEGFKVTVLHVLQEAEEDYFPNTAEKEEWLSQYRQKVNTLLDDCREILIRAGFDPKDVSVRSPLR
ncbi:MAG: universal stress protein, partial [Thermodesulfobacteriota bacterium]|nr:universal stress protein [Thermodesulfobacteriota bacterium]